MLRSLKKWFVKLPPSAAEEAYIALVAQARNPFFYTSLGVPDTLDGRFEMIVLHLFLLQQRLLHESDAATEFARELSEAFFADMDRALREMGIADTGVLYRIKAMAKAYHGRLQAYAAAWPDAEALHSALARNLYGTLAEGDPRLLPRMARYLRETADFLNGLGSEAIYAASISWPAPRP